MEIIKYDDKYIEDVKDLYEELQSLIVSLDEDHYNVKGPDFRDYYYNESVRVLNEYQGIIYLAIEDGKAVGLISGAINNEVVDNPEFKAGKRARVFDFIVKEEYRHLGIGSMLMKKIEEYFKGQGCEAILLNVFQYNTEAVNYYLKNGFHTRVLDMLKKI